MMRAYKQIVPDRLSKGLESCLSQYPSLVSLVLALFLLCVQLYFIRPYFLVNDDIYKILLTKGIGITSTPTPYFILSNVLLGLFFTKWFAWFPSFPLYSGFLCAIQFLSLWAFLWILCLRSSRGFHLILFIVSCLGVHFIFFTYLQFTQTASMAASAGMLLFVFSIEPYTGRRLYLWIFSGALLVSAWLIRPDSFLLVLLVSVPFILFKLWGSNFGEIFRDQWKFLSTLALLIFLSAGFEFAWFQKHEDWRDFQRLAVELQKTLEFQFSDYSPTTKPVFDSVGWSENDYWLFRDGYFMDPDRFNIATLEKFRAGLPRMDPEGKKSSFHSLRDLYSSSWDVRILLYFFAFWVFCRGSAMRFLLVQWAWISLIFLFLIYFMKATDRVTLPLLAYLMNLAIFFAENPFAKRPVLRRFLPGAQAAVLCAAFILAIPHLEKYRLQNLAKQRVEKQMKVCLLQIHPSEKQLYVLWDFPLEIFNAFDDFECLRPFRIFFPSGMERCPTSIKTLENFKVKDVFRDAVDNPNIFLVCNSEEGLHYFRYIKEHFKKVIYAQKVFDGGHFLKVFSIHSNQEP